MMTASLQVILPPLPKCPTCRQTIIFPLAKPPLTIEEVKDVCKETQIIARMMDTGQIVEARERLASLRDTLTRRHT